MTFEWFSGAAAAATPLFALASAFFAVLLLAGVYARRRMPETRRWLLVVFSVFAFASIAWFFGEFSYSLYVMRFGDAPYPSLADAFWAAGYLLFIVGYALFLWKGAFQHSRAHSLAHFASVIVVALALASLFSSLALAGETQAAALLDIFYPLAGAVVFLLAFRVYVPSAAGAIGVPLFLLALGAGADFIGESLFSYASTAGGYGLLGVAYDTAYMVGYLLQASAFYLLARQLKVVR